MLPLKSCMRVRNMCKILKNNVNFASFTVIKPIKPVNLTEDVAKCVKEKRLRSLCTTVSGNDLVDINTFEKACEDTLESLTEYFEQIVEDAENLKNADVSYSSGVLTVNLGPQFGTYVINRQSPNRQIWLSSPFSGPKRYDFVTSENCWVYKHDGQSLHGLLQKELARVVNFELMFGNCAYAKL